HRRGARPRRRLPGGRRPGRGPALAQPRHRRQRRRGAPHPRPPGPARRRRGPARRAPAHPRRRLPGPHRPEGRGRLMPMTTPVHPAAEPESPAVRLAHAVGDHLVLAGRSLRHVTRDVESLLLAVVLPVLMMLLFRYVFGGAISVPGRYVDYVVPGIILLCAGYGASLPAPGVAHDMAQGVIDRFRSLPIAPSAVLVGHVGASLARNLLS